jgi:hypothetical protein
MKGYEKELFKDRVAMNMGTQYGNTCGLDALQIQEMTTPNVNMGMGKPKGDNNRGSKGNQVVGTYFTVGRTY